ncbi:fatty acid--CoA ligase [Amycolatopsis balhimycina DSM 5908]|uniref:Fatty acid--CoA ligase n=1 Tax=Amycolatopsis balhimycina DSM 5908 TaxID=1081091 RepID=A0A428X678_AMYBA|nr:AMP-binding protein [Amycolatopsis balhimycina]RSM50835.1 fatty acid--CoA ligase [Amycolatopsis balhimycina DSM 5908]
MPYSRSLLGCLADFARTRPESAALVLGDVRVSYAEVCAMTMSAYEGLSAMRLPADARVAVHAAKTPRTVALIVACLLARRQFMLPSTELGATALEALLEKAGCTDVLTAEPVAGVGGRRIHKIDTTAVPPDGDLAGLDGITGPDVSPDATSFIFTTSGSTGLPKVVPLSFQAVERFTEWAVTKFRLRPGTVVLNYAPFNFDLCLLDIRATFKAGGTAVLVEPEKATHGKHLAEVIRSEGVEVVQSVPMLYRLLADVHDGRPFESVKHVIVTGDKMPAKLLPELPRLFPNARFHNIYGATETNDSFIHEITAADLRGDGPLPIGRPLPGVDALVLDAAGEVADGPATGELLVSTPFQTAGYAVGGEAGKFVERGGGRVYFRSGDLVERAADGVFTLVGRTDSQVKVRGVRVNLEEIEQVLLGHERIAGAAVVAVPDDVAGLAIHAVVRRDTTEPLGVLGLRQFCRERLARAALPTTIRVVDDPLPTTSTGKTDRKAVIRNLLNGS